MEGGGVGQDSLEVISRFQQRDAPIFSAISGFLRTNLLSFMSGDILPGVHCQRAEVEACRTPDSSSVFLDLRLSGAAMDQLKSCLPDCDIPQRRVELSSVSRRKKRRFIPPVPIEWFDCACVLPGKALAVGLIFRRLAKMKKMDSVVLTQAALNQHGFSR